MRHQASEADREFLRAFEARRVEPAMFDHPAHVRLAYCYLCSHPPELAAERMRDALRAFLHHLGAGEGKFHETITRAWILAVAHFMEKPPPHQSAADFMAANPELLDSKIMLTHYSAELLFSAAARATFVPPDIQAIPPEGVTGGGQR